MKKGKYHCNDKKYLNRKERRPVYLPHCRSHLPAFELRNCIESGTMESKRAKRGRRTHDRFGKIDSYCKAYVERTDPRGRFRVCGSQTPKGRLSAGKERKREDKRGK